MSYSTGQVGKICNVTQATVWNWIQGKKLRAYQTPGGRFMIRGDVLLQFLKKHNMPIPQDFDIATEKRILVVDDDKSIIDLIVRTFSLDGSEYALETAMDGYEAGTKIAVFKPDVVILDIKMPELDGFQACEKIKTNHFTSGIKVIAITGLDDSSVERIKECGADACFKKPLDLNELKKMVDFFLNPDIVIEEEIISEITG
ncbi:MAG: hypothetical protein A2161_12855 [Candidatus Schekmanbacteria bacterium RBG_13_48_7]|uniref:Response regulatory domain-containing protein n=1 Tax=Candidatus Schekmanbacteria bacterium RBG_13_48_7 TaxID=1817878 RepID=A0A1F7S4F2_9BACT|nr:MAG: hypothetical protein A2161_12855 [Candidatus Schekmanbacteria bacterium RBG_13_48_7]